MSSIPQWPDLRVVAALTLRAPEWAVRTVLAEQEVLATMRASALVALALVVARRSAIDAEGALKVLREHGFDPPDRERLVTRIKQDCASDDMFVSTATLIRPAGPETHRIRFVDVMTRTEALRALAPEARQVAIENHLDRFVKTLEPPGGVPESRTLRREASPARTSRVAARSIDRARITAIRFPALLGFSPDFPTLSEILRRKQTKSTTAQPGLARPGKKPPRQPVGQPETSPTPKIPPTPALIPVPVDPPAPPCVPPVVTFEVPRVDDLAAALCAPGSTLRAYAVVVRAHSLAIAAQFEELLSPGYLHGVESHRYQTEAVLRVLRTMRGRALLADEVGLGKTIEAIMTLREYQLRGMVRRTLVLVPPALVAQWTDELRDKAGLDARTTESLPAESDERASFWSDEGVVVASLALARSARHAGAVQSVAWDLVIVDEAHHLKHRSTLAWKLANQLKTRFLLLLTATPIESDLDELYNLVTLLRPGQFASPAAFRDRFVDKKDPTSPRNRDALRKLLLEVMVRNTRAQSGLRLPPRFVTTLVVDPSREEAALYEHVVAMLRAHAGEGRSRTLATTLMLEAGSSPNALRGTLARMAQRDTHGAPLQRDLAELARLAAAVPASAKTGALVSLLRAHPDQTLVFTRFRDTLEALRTALDAADLPFVALEGGLDAATRARVVERFRGGVPVMLATHVGSEGQNLQFCHQLVNYDLPWNPMVIEQRIGRLHRMGQSSEVRVWNLCARGSAEERVLDVLDRRVNLFQLVVGEMDMVVGNVTDERDLEDRVLEAYATARTDEELSAAFDTIAAELLAARGQYERARDLDDRLFGKDFTT